MLAIPESPSREETGEYLEPQADYFKSLTASQTLDRRSKHRARSAGNVQPVSAGAQLARPRYGHLDLSPSPNREIPTIQEPVLPATTKKTKKSFSKIAILSNFFEQ